MIKYVDPKLIKQELEKIRKSSHFGYQRVKDRAIRNPTTFAEHKNIVKQRKNLSNDRFATFITQLQKNHDASLPVPKTIKHSKGRESGPPKKNHD